MHKNCAKMKRKGFDMANQKKEKSKRTNSKKWYDIFMLLSVICMFGLGIGGFGYGTVKSVSDAVKNRRNVKSTPKKAIEIDTTYWNRLWVQQDGFSK